MDGDAMAAGLARRLDHRLGRDARRPPAGAVRRTLHRAALARGRRTVASGCACGAGRDYERYYYLLGSVGRKALAIAGVLLRILLKRLPGDGPGTPLVFAIDDSPTKRYGPHVEAGKYHNPTPDRPGPRSSTATSGSVWPAWSDTRSGERSPCRSSRTCTSEPKMSAGWRPLRLAVPHQVGAGRRPDRVAGPAVGARSHADLGGNRRAYVKRPFLKRVLGAGVTGSVGAGERPCGRCRRWSIPARRRSWPAAEVRQGPDRPGQTRRADPGLANRAFSLYGRLVVKKYKTFLATYKPVGG